MDAVRCTNVTRRTLRCCTSRLRSSSKSQNPNPKLQIPSSKSQNLRLKLAWDLGFGGWDLGFARQAEPEPQTEQAGHEEVCEEQQRYRHRRLARYAERLQQNRVELLAQSKAIHRNRNVAEQRGGGDRGQQCQICRMRRCVEQQKSPIDGRQCEEVRRDHRSRLKNDRWMPRCRCHVVTEALGTFGETHGKRSEWRQ